MMTTLLQPTICAAQIPQTLTAAALNEIVAPFGDPRPFLEMALSTSHFVRTDITLLEALLGSLPKFAPGEVPCQDEERTGILWALPEAGVLYQLPAGDLLAVHRLDSALGVMARRFCHQHDHERLWAAVDVVYPGCVPGKARPRFALMRERPSLPGCESTYAIVDLCAGEILERGSEEAAARARCRWANTHPEAALSAMALERAQTPFVRRGAPRVRS